MTSAQQNIDGEKNIFIPETWEDLYSQAHENVLTHTRDSWIYSSLKKIFENREKNKTTIFGDFGAGLGRHSLLALSLLDKKKDKIVAIDASPTAAGMISQIITEQCMLGVISSNTVDLMKPLVKGRIHYAGEINIGVLTDVISIVENPEKVLENIHQTMTENGVLFVTIQSTKDETYGDGKKREEYSKKGLYETYEKGIGVRFYTEKGVRNLIESSGWKITESNEFFRHDPPHFMRPKPHSHHYFGLRLEKK